MYVPVQFRVKKEVSTDVDWRRGKKMSLFDAPNSLGVGTRSVLLKLVCDRRSSVTCHCLQSLPCSHP